MIFFRKVAHKFVRSTRLAQVVTIALALGFSVTGVSAIAPGSEIKLDIVNTLGYPSNNASLHPGNTLTVDTHVDWAGGLLIKGDMYVGILDPKNDTVWTWTVTDGIARLAPGMDPILEDLELKEPVFIKPSTMLAAKLDYTFTGYEPEGFYLAFVIMVAADLDPGSQYNYIGTRMEPLFVQRVE